jgi:hypothetical protein
MRFKKFTWNWTSFIVGVHAGRNPVSGKRFLYVGLGPFLGLDFHWPKDNPSSEPVAPGHPADWQNDGGGI